MSDDARARTAFSAEKRGSAPRFGARFQIWFGLALGLGTLYLAARGLDSAALIATLRGVRLPFVMLTLVTSLLTIVLKAVRWDWLLYPDRQFGRHAAHGATEHGNVMLSGLTSRSPLRRDSSEASPSAERRDSSLDSRRDIPHGANPRRVTVGGILRTTRRLLQLSGLIVVGQAVNFYVPARLGELVRAYLTGEELRVSKAYALGTIAAEKLIDLVMLAALTVALLPFLALPNGVAGQAGPLVVLALALCAGAAALLTARGTVIRLAETGLRRLPVAWADRWRARIGAGLDGLAALRNRRAASAAWGWTFAFWLVAAATNYLLLLAFDLPPSPLMALFLLAVLQGGVAVPSTPGKVGVFHYLCQLALAVFGVPAAVGLSYGLVLHLVVVGGVSLWAAGVLWQRSWSLRRLTAAVQ